MANKPALRDQRLKIMEGVLSWEGEIGNARVRQLFGLQPVQASRLLAEFRAMLGDKLREDGRAKVLRWANPAASECPVPLDEYALHTWASEGGNPCLVDARVDLTEVSPAIFATLRKAVLTKTGVEIEYASMSTPEYARRVIFPHVLVHIGRRWHARAWCAKRQEFRDFNVGRIRAATALPNLSAPCGAGDDRDWNQTTVLRLAAHRGLSPNQQKVVRDEFFGGMKGRRLGVRVALAQYVIQDIRAALDPEKEVPPEYQLELVNPEDLQKWS